MSMRNESDPGSEEATALVAGGSQPFSVWAETPTDDVSVGAGERQDSRREHHAPSLRLLLRYKWSIVATVLLVGGPAIAGIWLLTVPKYRARATLQISANTKSVMYRTDDTGPIHDYTSYLNTQVGYISESVVIDGVLDMPEVQQTAWYNGGDGDARKPIRERLRDGLSVRPRGRTYLIDIDFASRNRKDAETIVNAVVDKYRHYVGKRNLGEDNEILQKLTDEKTKLEAEISAIESNVDQWTRAIGATAPDDLITQQTLRLDSKQAELQSVELELAIEKRQLSSLGGDSTPTSAPSASQPTATSVASADPDSQPVGFEHDLEWRRLNDAVQRIATNLSNIRIRMGDENPTVLATREELRAAEAARRLYERVLESGGDPESPVTTLDPTQRRIEELRTNIELLNDKYTRLGEQLSTGKEDFASKMETARVLRRALKDLSRFEKRYDIVLRRIDEERVEGKMGRVHVISPAFAPSEPYQDRRALLSVGALIGALMAGFALAYVRGMHAQTICGADELPEQIQTPFLGMLPLERTALAPLTNDCPVQNEHYRMLRTALMSRMNSEGGASVVVTSAGPGAGKTTVAISLARSFAECGKRVLLIDSDLRNPDVSEQFGLVHATGLTAVIASESQDSEAIVQSAVPGLSVLPAGVGESGNPEVLVSGGLQTCIERWREAYDLVLLDSAPILPVADTRILVRHCDGAILVIREGACRRGDIMDSLAYLSVSGGNLLGTVFVGSLQRKRYYDGEYAGYYGGSAGERAAS